jgi:AcrR family transcriptional regulator
MIQAPEHIDKKEQILTEAEKLFSEQDFDSVSVRDIAKAANVNIAMISYYFGSKEKLFETLIIRRVESSQAVLQFLVTSEMSILERVQGVIDHYVDKLIDNRNVHRMINRELSTNTRTHLRDRLMNMIRENRQSIKGLMEEGVRIKEFKPDMDIDMTIMNFFATINHTVGASYYSCDMFDKKNEEDLFTPEFKDRLKKYFKELFTYNLITNQ